MNKFIHAVPNFSEGRRKEVIETIVDQVRNIEGVKLIDYYPDPDFNRTVVEIIGKPSPLKEALLNMAEKSFELINMEEQSGNHPRIGSQDTIPIFPLTNVTLEECIELAEEIGQEVYKRYKVPVYFSGENARNEKRESLDYIRKGQFESLMKLAHLPERAPDIGPAALHPTAGATIVSAGGAGLVAVNVLLGTNDLNVAKTIARMVRGPSGGFSTIRAIGLFFEEKNQVAVSMNMLDIGKTPIHRVFKVIENEAGRYGVSVVATQIIGTLPQEALISCAEFFLKLEHFNRDQIIENHLVDL
ncbi:MAG: glutamate formimidoyltransferase [Syntrophomonadaceae bacterium]|nr:glutamate formimidoyltransferase [Syntrophomonadaceae bacterium]MDD3889582.1 glutamate formimidoyltransferase [Syntrophomonadaceae bacterium]MDD4548638.1 glutamate formimidoyltransferase [Syntrophomonadaceae bacterium]